MLVREIWKAKMSEALHRGFELFKIYTSRWRQTLPQRRRSNILETSVDVWNLPGSYLGSESVTRENSLYYLEFNFLKL